MKFSRHSIIGAQKYLLTRNFVHLFFFKKMDGLYFLGPRPKILGFELPEGQKKKSTSHVNSQSHNIA
jgi:hypothetical protein